MFFVRNSLDWNVSELKNILLLQSKYKATLSLLWHFHVGIPSLLCILYLPTRVALCFACFWLWPWESNIGWRTTQPRQSGRFLPLVSRRQLLEMCVRGGCNPYFLSLALSRPLQQLHNPLGSLSFQLSPTRCWLPLGLAGVPSIPFCTSSEWQWIPPVVGFWVFQTSFRFFDFAHASVDKLFMKVWMWFYFLSGPWQSETLNMLWYLQRSVVLGFDECIFRQYGHKRAKADTACN